MPLTFVLVTMLLGIGVALYRRNPRAVMDGPTEDAPMRLLRSTVGLLSERRQEWGQAMLGELDSIEGRGRRWRFALNNITFDLALLPLVTATVGWAAAAATARIRPRLATNPVFVPLAAAGHVETAAWPEDVGRAVPGRSWRRGVRVVVLCAVVVAAVLLAAAGWLRG